MKPENCTNCPQINSLRSHHDNDVAEIKATIILINEKLEIISPYIETEMERSKAYRIVSGDLNTKITSIKFWVPILFTIVLTIYLLFNRK